MQFRFASVLMMGPRLEGSGSLHYVLLMVAQRSTRMACRNTLYLLKSQLRIGTMSLMSTFYS